MRIVKLAVWLVILYVLQTVFAGLIAINGAVPELMLAFAVVYAFCETGFAAASNTALVCGMLAGCVMGNSFPLSVLIIGSWGLISFYGKNVLRFIPAVIRCVLLTAAAALLMGTAECFAVLKAISLGSFLTEILPYTIYTAAAAVIIYPLAGRTFFKKEDEKKLLMI